MSLSDVADVSDFKHYNNAERVALGSTRDQGSFRLWYSTICDGRLGVSSPGLGRG
jgi:hypothetical protein